MAYSSTVSAPQLLVGRLGSPSTSVPGAVAGSLWTYTSTVDALATVVGSSYLSDGWNRGMRKWDHVIFVDINSTLTSWLTVTAVTTASGGVTCSSLLTT